MSNNSFTILESTEVSRLNRPDSATCRCAPAATEAGSGALDARLPSWSLDSVGRALTGSASQLDLWFGWWPFVSAQASCCSSTSEDDSNVPCNSESAHPKHLDASRLTVSILERVFSK